MIRPSVALALGVALATTSQGLAAQDSTRSTAPASRSASAGDPIGDWLARRRISIRKAFDGSQSEQNPANIFWVREPTGKDTSYALIDIGVRASQVEWTPCHDCSLILSPTVEYHYASGGSSPQDKLSFAPQLEFRPIPLRLQVDVPAAQRGWPIAPVFALSAKVAYDFQLQKTEQTYSALLYPTSAIPGLPGRDWRRSDGAYMGRYYVYPGVEHYRFGTAGVDSAGTAALLRLWFEFYPVTTVTSQFVQLTFDASYRRVVSGTLFAGNDATDVTTSANLYLDGHGHVGIGVDYASGRDASKHFVRRRRTSFGFKLKF